jgi:dipeptidyl aminopeptidase/acylaminoacyl peptidase
MSVRKRLRLRLRCFLARCGLHLGILALPCMLVASAQANPAAPSAEVFGAVPAESLVALSPDGRWIAWRDETEPKPRIVIFDLNARRTQRVEPLAERAELYSLQWSDHETLLASVSEAVDGPKATSRERWYSFTLALNATGEGAVVLPSSRGYVAGLAAGIGARLIRARTTKPHTAIMSSGAELLEVDTTTGKAEKLRFGNAHTVGWAVDQNGKPVAREDWDWKSGSYRVYALEDDSMREILRRDDSSAPTVAGLLPDDSALVLLDSDGHRHQAAWALPLDGSPRKLLAEDPDADITNAYADAHTGAIVGFYESGTKTSVEWLDPVAQRRQQALERSFPNARVSVYGWTVDGTKTLALVQSPSSPPIYYLVDFKTHKADIAAEEYPALAGATLGELKEITYKARDGTEIPAYLTLPPDAGSGVHPLVVLPHGDANGRDYPYFNWVVQFLASRGYAVLQPEFRGSAGFGEAFEKAGFRQWGSLMQDDVTDGVLAMIEQKIADPKRVCIVGFSYGGYVALAGAAFTPDLYACAISVNGISDLRALFNESVPQSRPGLRVTSAMMSSWVERIGPPNDRNLDKRSPIHSVASIKAPILIIYASSDGVIPNTQSQKMEQALRSAGKQVMSLELSGESHVISRSETRAQMLKAFDDFLHKNLRSSASEGIDESGSSSFN